MNEAEAKARCAELARTDEDRRTHQWHPRRGPGGEWQVVKVALPATSVVDTSPEQRADEKPTTGDDPRTSFVRNVGGPYIGG